MDIKRLKELCEKATPGPWKTKPSKGDCALFKGNCPRGLNYCDEQCRECKNWEIYEGASIEGPEIVECGDYGYFTEEDAEFIAAARTALPDALEEIDELRVIIKELLTPAMLGAAEHDIDINDCLKRIEKMLGVRKDG